MSKIEKIERVEKDKHYQNNSYNIGIIDKGNKPTKTFQELLDEELKEIGGSDNTDLDDKEFLYSYIESLKKHRHNHNKSTKKKYKYKKKNKKR